jgi:type III pantothenate kinase
MILDVDIGNSRIKWQTRDSCRVLERGVCSSIGYLVELLRDHSVLPQRTRVCCVGDSAILEQLDDWLQQNQLPSLERAVAVPFAANVKNGYEEPQQLGVDRWLVVCAAWHKTRRATVVADAGSAMTIDFIDASGGHCGGYIVPGIAMQQGVLLANTQRVRFDTDLSRVALVPGRTTVSAVNNGIACMLTAMIESAALGFSSSPNELPQLLITGGDAPVLAPLLKLPYSFEPDLVLEGIDLVMP